MAIRSQDCGVQWLDPAKGILVSLARVIGLTCDRRSQQQAGEQQIQRPCHDGDLDLSLRLQTTNQRGYLTHLYRHLQCDAALREQQTIFQQ